MVSNLEEPFESLFLESDGSEGNSDNQIDFTALENSSDSEESEEENSGDRNTIIDSWTPNIVKPVRWEFKDDSSGLNTNLLSGCKNPIDFYKLFLDDEIMEHIVHETNRYGISIDANFQETDAEELFTFFATCLLMGYVRMPNLHDYWSTDPAIGGSAITRTRFSELMKSLHLANNSNTNPARKLFKIEEFLNLFITKYKRAYRPTKDVCIDESLIPYRGRLKFKQYIPTKRHKYGIKIFKLCSQGGYTYNMLVYSGKEDQPRKGMVAEDVVMRLMGDLVGQGRTLYTDNFYTTVPLAKSLIAQKTNLIGTCRNNRIGFPKSVTNRKLKKNQTYAEQNNDGITVLKWKDKRDVLVLSTMHDNEMKENKPLIVTEYNKGKAFIDLSDQMAAYSPYIRRTCKWYLRIFFHTVCQVAIVNAHILYKVCTGNNIGIVDFKKQIVTSVLNLKKERKTTRKRRFLEHIEMEPNAKRRPTKRCIRCYTQLSNEVGVEYARNKATRVSKICSLCCKPYCDNCFNNHHLSC